VTEILHNSDKDDFGQPDWTGKFNADRAAGWQQQKEMLAYAG
jgi:hypothetical protein